MRNPLIKRIPREFKHDIGKYLAIFIFMTLFIGMVSGFIVVDSSFLDVYNRGFTEKKIEDGHFSFDKEAPAEILDRLYQKGGVDIFPYFYFEEEIKDTEKNIRVYSTERELNFLCLMSGEMPSEENEIALDRMFAENNSIDIGDKIFLKDKELTVSGYVASPDYSSLFENNSDMMFDSINFSVGIMTQEGFDSFGSERITYNYAWLFPQFIERKDTVTAKKMTDDFIDAFETVVTDYNEAIIDKAIEYGKMITLHESLEAMDASLKEYGSGISVYDNDEGYSELLKLINEQLETEDVNLSDELADGEKEILLTVSDVKSAMKATIADIENAEEYIENIDSRISEVNDFLPRYINQAINFVGEDMGGDKIMFILFDYILTVVLAFVFAITVSNTITSEASVIGTLRASGYTKGELLSHYIVLPVLVTFISAVIGNILGYTAFSGFFIDLYYGSYSLANYEALWSAEAFILTTLIPVAIMLVINISVISGKLKLSPLKLIRRDLSSSKSGRAVRLNTKIPFINRFRLRIILQNIPGYITMFFGIFIGGVLVVFGTMFGPLLADYKELIVNDRICDYQYILTEQAETSDAQAEKYAVTSLKTTDKRFMEDEISIFGIESGSQYVNADISDGILAVSNGITEKFGLAEGDVITLKDPYNDKKLYDFTIGTIYNYNSGMAIFMTHSDYCEKFGESADYFTGYFSNSELSDIDDGKVAAVITVSDMTKASDQLTTSLGEMMSLFKWLGVIVFALLMFIMSKQIIEKNANSISMTKILGFSNGEIGGLYITATSAAVVISLLISIPLIDIMIKFLFEAMLYTRMTGFIPFAISADSYIQMFVLGICSYAVIAIVQMKKINRIPKSIALKNVE